ncbi:unnamed protein product [Allacma fusca]|uniref:MOSC domain-containing protein n=1 Tax=Allacma fusca TaxID=39272 RepID=A0A8J2KM08_9HEXA|nr:unnamed protein product [Allacma fusca]
MLCQPNMVEVSWKSAAALSAAFATGSVATLLWGKLNKEKMKPEKWIRVGTVGELMVYPVKSCQGTSVNECTATEIGFKVTNFFRDRIFTVVNTKGETRRMTDLPKLALISPTIKDDTLTLSTPDKDPITISIPKDTPEARRTCSIFGEHVKCVLDCGSEVNKWLSEFLESDVFLYYHHDVTTQRHALTDSQKQFSTFSKLDKGTFQDETSYMFLTEESVEELNKRLDTPVTFLSFRPNIVIKGVSEPFAEDFWNFVRIGDESGPIFKASQPCLRCKLTNIDPSTGTTNPRGDPLRTLHKMKRKLGNEELDRICRTSAAFGLHLGLYKNSQPVKNGDPVYAAAL